MEPMTFEAATWLGGAELHLLRNPVPEALGRDLLIRVDACGICGTDIHLLEGRFPIHKPPRVPGHEFAGTVVAVGPEVRAVEIGARVAVEPNLSCFSCFYCRDGASIHCQHRTVYPGGFAQFALAHEASVFELPHEISLEIGTMAEPVSCALHAIDRAAPRPGDVVLIIGGGAIGLILTQLALISGAARVIVSEPDATRRHLAGEFGALAVDPKADDLRSVIADLTSGLGADVAIEAVGVDAAIQDALRSLRRAGRAVLMGVPAPDSRLTLQPFDLFEREISIAWSYVRQYEFGRAVRLLPRLRLEPLIGRRFPLSDIRTALDVARVGDGIKTLVRPNDSGQRP